MKTLLERARGSPLTILVSGMDSTDTMALLPPYTKQIADLKFINSRWADIQRFSEINSGPLPLLRTLNINVTVRGIGPDGLLFSGAVGLKEFHLYSEGLPSLSHFVFPNLTSFELSVAIPRGQQYHGLQLLDFLDASPMLQAVHVNTVAPISLEGVPQNRVVVLRNVENFCLRDGGSRYKLAAHISCPSAKCTSLTHSRGGEIPHGVFPSLASRNAILRQYMTSPVEEITLDIETEPGLFIACSLTLSSDAAITRLRFEDLEGERDPSEFNYERPSTMLYYDAFSEASETIRDLPLLANVKRLHMHGHPELEEQYVIESVADELGRLLTPLVSLEELTISRCDTRPYFCLFLDLRAHMLEGPVVFPPIKVLSVSHQIERLPKYLAERLVELAKAQHNLGIPFERVIVRMCNPPADMEERLRPWVGVVDCCVVSDERN